MLAKLAIRDEYKSLGFLESVGKMAKPVWKVAQSGSSSRTNLKNFSFIVRIYYILL